MGHLVIKPQSTGLRDKCDSGCWPCPFQVKTLKFNLKHSKYNKKEELERLDVLGDKKQNTTVL